MKINPYYISAAVAVVVIVIIFVSRRDNATREWNPTNFILSADNNGNLTPITEDFFKQKEAELLAKVNVELGKVNTALGGLNTRVDNVYTKTQTYTQTEINNKLAGKAPSTHSHNYATGAAVDTAIAAALVPYASANHIKNAIKKGRDQIPKHWSTYKDFHRYANGVYNYI